MSYPFLEGNWKCRFPPRKKKCQNVLLCGWMGGWVDGWMDGWMGGWVGGDFLPLLIFVIFKYDKKQNELHPKICLKVAFAY